MNSTKIESYLNSYLRVNEIDDYSYNGLQVIGTDDDEVAKVGFAVDSGIKSFEAAIAAD